MAATAQRQPPVVEEAESLDDDALIARYIVRNNNEPGRAYARMRETGPDVSSVVRSVIDPDGGIAHAMTDWGISETAVGAAVAFYRRHRQYIDARILLENDASMWDDEWVK